MPPWPRTIDPWPSSRGGRGRGTPSCSAPYTSHSAYSPPSSTSRIVIAGFSWFLPLAGWPLPRSTSPPGFSSDVIPAPDAGRRSYRRPAMAGSATGSRHDERRPCRVVITDVSSFRAARRSHRDTRHVLADRRPGQPVRAESPQSRRGRHRSLRRWPREVDKQPLASWRDPQFASEARELRGTTFLAHVRYGGRSSRANWCT